MANALTREPTSVIFQFWFLRNLLLTICWRAARPARDPPAVAWPWRRCLACGITESDLGIFFRTTFLFFFYCGALLQVRDWNAAHAAVATGLWMLAILRCGRPAHGRPALLVRSKPGGCNSVRTGGQPPAHPGHGRGVERCPADPAHGVGLSIVRAIVDRLLPPRHPLADETS